MKTKILHIAEPFATGVLSFLLDITKRQVEDFEVYIIYGMRPLTPDNVESLFDKRVKLIKLDSFQGVFGSVLNINTYFQLRRLQKKINPDIIHLHSSAAGFIGRWALPVRRIKTFYTPHGFSFLNKEASLLKNKFFWALEFVSAKRQAKIIACSSGEYEEAKKITENCTYINNGINTSPLNKYLGNNFLKQNPEKVTVCTSGRILFQKNPTLFNQIALLLPDVHFVWIGDGDLVSQITAPNVEITGWITREKALSIISEANFFILPSRWEGLSISLLEAMYLKKICLVSNIPGNKDVIENGINGFVCNTPEDYKNNINKIVTKSMDADQIVSQCHEDVIKNYTVELMANSYKKVYQTNYTK